MTAPIPAGASGNWADFAACRDVEDPDLFFPDGEGRQWQRQIERAKSICRGCPAQTECQADALTRPEKFGIWGGMTEEERRQARRRSGYQGALAS